MFTKEANFVHKICNICRQPFRTKQAAGDEAPAACLKKSHRVHGSQAANQLKSVFCGGVYAAKNTLRASGVSQPRRLRRCKARSAAKLSHQFAERAN